ncbi:hypothetical protein Droror1_Dr00007754 [Drosera rotundifolia]
MGESFPIGFLLFLPLFTLVMPAGTSNYVAGVALKLQLVIGRCLQCETSDGKVLRLVLWRFLLIETTVTGSFDYFFWPSKLQYLFGLLCIHTTYSFIFGELIKLLVMTYNLFIHLW